MLVNAELNKLRPQVAELAKLKTKNTALTNKIEQLTTTVENLANKVHNLTNQIVALTGGTIAWTYEGVPKPTESQSLEDKLNALQTQLAELDKVSTNVTNTTSTYTQQQQGLVYVNREERNKNVIRSLSYTSRHWSGLGYWIGTEEMSSIFISYFNSNVKNEISFWRQQISHLEQGKKVNTIIEFMNGNLFPYFKDKHPNVNLSAKESNYKPVYGDFSNVSKLKEVLDKTEELVFEILKPIPEEGNKNLLQLFYKSELIYRFIGPVIVFTFGMGWITKKPFPFEEAILELTRTKQDLLDYSYWETPIKSFYNIS